MSREQGSPGVSVDNPFRIEGWLDVGRGLPVLVLGCILAFTVQADVAGDASWGLWIRFSVGVVLIVSGLVATGQGLLRASSFHTDESVPSDLAVSPRDYQTRVVRGRAAYTVDQVSEMMTGTKNLNHREPRTGFERAIFGVAPRLRYLPPPIQTITLRLAVALGASALALALWGLAAFSGAAGLTKLQVTAVGDYYPWLVAVVLIVLWRRILGGQALTGASRRQVTGGVGVLVAIVMLAPVLVAQSGMGEAWSEVPTTGIGILVGVALGLGVLVAGLGAALLALRLPAASDRAFVSESRDSRQETVQPADLFQSFETAMVDARLLPERPNRIYRAIDPARLTDGGSEKGSFKGEAIIELQPVSESVAEPRIAQVAAAGSALGTLLVLTGSVWLFFAASSASGWDSQTTLNLVLWPLVFYSFGRAMQTVARLYRSEVPFSSNLALFRAEGTYAESRVSTGMATFDSTRSENVLVRTNAQREVRVVRIVSSTFADAGSRSLKHQRFVLAFDRDDGFLQMVLDGLDRAIGGRRRNIADISDHDIQSAGTYQELNQANLSRATGRTVIEPPPTVPPEALPGPAGPALPGTPDDSGDSDDSDDPEDAARER